MCNFSNLFVHISIFLKLELREITFKFIYKASFLLERYSFYNNAFDLKNEISFKNAVTILFIFTIKLFLIRE